MTPEHLKLKELAEAALADVHDGNAWIAFDEACTPEAILSPLKDLDKAEATILRLEPLVHVPGQWRCAKCKFVVHKMVLCASTGAVGLKPDTATEPCPNGCGPLWPCTWKEDAFECGNRLEQQHDEIAALKARAEKAEQERDEANAKAAVLGEALKPFARLGSMSAFHAEGVIRMRHAKNIGTTIDYRCFRDANDAICHLDAAAKALLENQRAPGTIEHCSRCGVSGAEYWAACQRPGCPIRPLKEQLDPQQGEGEHMMVDMETFKANAISLYDSDTGQSLEMEKHVDVTAHQTMNKSAVLAFTRAKRGRIAQLQSGCMQIHYFIDEQNGRRMMNEDSGRFGFAPGALCALALEYTP